MADGHVQVAPDSTGAKIDTSELTVGGQTVDRQRIVLASDNVAAALARIHNGDPSDSDYALIARIAGRVAQANPYQSFEATNLAASGVLGDTWQDLGASPSRYARFNLHIHSAQAGTYYLQGSANQSNVYMLSTGAVAANTPLLVTVPAPWRYARGYLQNGGTLASFAAVAVSLTAA